MKTTTLVLMLLLTARGLWAQTPPPGLTPAQARQMQMRLRALTNNPAGVPGGLPASPGFNAPPTVAPASAAPAPAPANSMATPDTSAASPAGTAAPEQEVAGYTYNFPGVDVNQVLEVYSESGGTHAAALECDGAADYFENAVAADQDRGD